MSSPWDPSQPQTPGYGPPPGQPPYGPPPGQPPYGPPPGQPPYGGAPLPVRETEQKAVVALVLAIASFVAFPLVPAIVALFLARDADRTIRASGGRLEGEGLVTAARVISWINIGLSALVLAAVVVVIIGVVATAG